MDSWRSHASSADEDQGPRGPRSYDHVWSRYLSAPQSQLTQELELRPGLRLLDLGCGTGFQTVEMLKAVFPGEVVAVDARPAMLAVARTRARFARLSLTAVQGALPAVVERLPADSFDVVSVRFGLQALDPRRLAIRLASVLRPGGRVGLLTSLASSVPQAWAALHELGESGRSLGPARPSDRADRTLPATPRELADTLSEAGLRIVTFWDHQLRVWFDSGSSAVTWLRSSGTLEPGLVDRLSLALPAGWTTALADRLQRLREPAGIPLDFHLAGVVAGRGLPRRGPGR